MSDLIDLDPILRPIPGDDPAGAYLYGDAVYRQIEEARTRDADWRAVLRLGLGVLAERSKDLQVAAGVTEALGRLHGLDGLRQGFAMLTALQEAYWPVLHPLPDEGDLEPRIAPYEFLEAALPPILDVTIPLTAATASENYNRRQFGHPSMGDEDKDARNDVIRRTDLAFHRALAADLEACRGAYDAWRKDLQRDDRLGGRAPAFLGVTSLLDDLASCVRTIEKLRPFRAAEVVKPAEPLANAPAEARAVEVADEAEGEEPEGPREARRSLAAEAAALADGGRLDAAIRLLDGARQGARCRRDRYIRQIELVEVCLRVSQVTLARPLAEELLTILDERKLEEWEDPALCARVLHAWLVCLKGAGHAEDASPVAEIWQRLCRLDPALAMLPGR